MENVITRFGLSQLRATEGAATIWLRSKSKSPPSLTVNLNSTFYPAATRHEPRKSIGEGERRSAVDVKKPKVICVL